MDVLVFLVGGGVVDGVVVVVGGGVVVGGVVVLVGCVGVGVVFCCTHDITIKHTNVT